MGHSSCQKFKTIKEKLGRIFLEAVFCFCCYSAAATQTPTPAIHPLASSRELIDL